MIAAQASRQRRIRKRPPGLLIHPALRPGEAEVHHDYLTTILYYGTKVAGLQILPSVWVPPYVALPAWLSEEWAANPSDWLTRAQRKQVQLEQACALVSDSGKHKIIVRSSAVGEGLDDRGLYKSICIEPEQPFNAIVTAIEDIFAHFANQTLHTAMGICLQRYMQPDFAGHVSNELHLSATRNQWKYGIEIPAFAPDRGLNSKFARAPDEIASIALTSQKDIGQALRRVCNWANLRVDGRSHLEWCAASGRLWVVQLDQESPTSAGANPHTMPEVRATASENKRTSCELFQLYRIQEDPPWRKLRNLRDFWTGAEPPRHRLYYADGSAIEAALARRGGAAKIAAEIDVLTSGRAVLRTDCVNTTIKPFNLPRTHTVNGKAAAAWLRETLAVMQGKGARSDEVAIILHQYIPARAAAWSFYSPGDDFVQIDCLWGLPDGLQFLSHDSFQVDARTGEELSAQVRYKPDFLQEQDDGAWRYLPIARQYGRDRVLSRDALRTLALETVAISRKIKDRAQIMWFCDLPEELGLGQHLPWYRSKEFVGFAAAQRPPLPVRRARSLADLDDLEKDEGRFIILVAPDVELVRNDDLFLDRVIELARSRDLPVELAGSVLGHAYYRLRGAGILVIVPQPKYPRVRGRQRHFKVVRDAIPQNIAAKGERVSFARLAPGEAWVALIGKLFEEGLELNAARAADQKLEELADVLEVLRGLASNAGVEWDALMEMALDKRAKRGGFEQQTVLLETARPMPNRPATLSMAGDDDEVAVFLRDLGVVAVDGSLASISFSRLLANDATQVELAVGGRTMRISASLGGLGLQLLASEVHPDEEESDSQLDLFDRA
jgi:predicted house-cleaning noncanonical NTP pyrophosphatase (MazG superfamily)